MNEFGHGSDVLQNLKFREEKINESTLQTMNSRDQRFNEHTVLQGANSITHSAIQHNPGT